MFSRFSNSYFSLGTDPDQLHPDPQACITNTEDITGCVEQAVRIEEEREELRVNSLQNFNRYKSYILIYIS